MLPDPPHTNTFQVFADGAEEPVMERLLAVIEREQVVPSGPWWASARVPGQVTTEVTIQQPALAHDPATVAGWYAEIVGL